MRIFHVLGAAALAALGFVVTSQFAAQAQTAHTVAQTPPMGWNSWNYFSRNVTENDVKQAADALVSTGMKDAGYVYVNIDDTWEGTRNAAGVLSTNSKFPDMKGLANYVHSKGLKLGIYSGPGPKTCAGYEASYGHEQQDADLYASWGIDYLKYDLCSFRQNMQERAPNDNAAQMKMMIAAYAKMDKALKSTGRPIVFSFCQYGWDAVWEWAPSVGGNLWRTTDDIKPNWISIYSIIEEQGGLSKYAGPGHWNDPDMLEVGNGMKDPRVKGGIRYLSLAEDRSHFSMWAMLAAPLLAGNDLTHMDPDVLKILTNRDVISIDQDRLGHEATRAYADGEVEVWVRHLEHGAMAVAVLNAGSDRYTTHPFHLNLTRLGLHGPQKGKDLWTGKQVALTNDEPIEIASHDILLVRIPQPK
jgi:alpha-galactosidase